MKWVPFSSAANVLEFTLGAGVLFNLLLSSDHNESNVFKALPLSA
jgi:phospholipid N-methyltransferase